MSGTIFLVNLVGKIPSLISLSVTLGLIADSVVVWLWKTRGQGEIAAAVDTQS